MIAYVEEKIGNNNKKPLEVVREHSKITGYQVNIQKSIAFQYTSNEGIWNFFKMAFTIAPRDKIKVMYIYEIYKTD